MSESFSTLDRDDEPSKRPCLRLFTPAMLAPFDGSVAGRPTLLAYRGRVYDVTASFMWMTGRHFWLKGAISRAGSAKGRMAKNFSQGFQWSAFSSKDRNKADNASASA